MEAVGVLDVAPAQGATAARTVRAQATGGGDPGLECGYETGISKGPRPRVVSRETDEWVVAALETQGAKAAAGLTGNTESGTSLSSISTEFTVREQPESPRCGTFPFPSNFSIMFRVV